jgi:hypothetical protein
MNAGDLFINYNFKPGHVGLFIATKRIKAESSVLCIDANASSDGKVRIFKVDSSNFDVKFGPYPYKKVFISKPGK